MDLRYVRELSTFYRRHLLEDVMPFWEEHSIDREYGGYLTCLDRYGTPTDERKCVWFQARQVWMFATLCQRVEPRPRWQRAAEHGCRFLMERCYAGDGVWRFQLSRNGEVEKADVSIFSDLYAALALAAYFEATGDEQALEVAATTWRSILQRLADPQFEAYYPQAEDMSMRCHSVSMMRLMVGLAMERAVPEVDADRVVDDAAHTILYVHAKDDRKALFENVRKSDDGFDDSPRGRLVNPGHVMESCWLCMDAAVARRDAELARRALHVMEWTWPRAWDETHGGIVSYVDWSAAEPQTMEWHRAAGLRWDDKVWWTNSETLVALAYAFRLTGEPKHLERLDALHAWCQAHFFDASGREWYAELRRDGTPKSHDKGNPWKAAFHLPRALLRVHELLAECGTPSVLGKLLTGRSG